MGDIPRQLKHVFSPTSLAAHLAKFTPLWSSLAASDIFWWMKVNIIQEHKLRYTLPRASIFFMYIPTWLIQEGDHHGRRGFGHCGRGESGLEMLRKKKSSDDQRIVTKGFFRVSQILKSLFFFLNGFLGVQNLVKSKQTDLLLRLDLCETRWNDCWSHSTLTCLVPFGRWVWDL